MASLVVIIESLSDFDDDDYGVASYETVPSSTFGFSPAYFSGIVDDPASIRRIIGGSDPAASTGGGAVDTTPPAAPTIDALPATSNQQPTLTGTYDSSDFGTLVINVNGTVYTATTTSSDTGLTLTPLTGTWALDLAVAGQTLPPGTYDIQATSTDAAGNSTADTSTDEVEVDTSAPANPTVNTLLTNSTQPTVTGTYDPSNVAATDALSVTVDGSTYLSDTDAALTLNSGAGTWALDLAAAGQSLAEGVFNISVTQTGATATTSSDTTADEVEVDLTGPAAPTINTLTTTDTQPTITGTFDEADTSTLTVEIDGSMYTLGTDAALTNTGNAWSLDLGVAGQTLALSTFDVIATAVDAAGNQTTDASSNEITVNSGATQAVGFDFGDLNGDKLSGTYGISFGQSGTILARINPVSVGTGQGALVNIQSAAGNGNLATLFIQNDGGGNYTVAGRVKDATGATITSERSLTGTDLTNLFDGNDKFAMVTWSDSGSVRLTYGANPAIIEAIGATNTWTSDSVKLGYVTSDVNAYGGKAEVAIFNSVISGTDFGIARSQGTLANVIASNSASLIANPRPASGVGQGIVIATPSTQVEDEVAQDFAIVNLGGAGGDLLAGDF